MTHIEGSSGLRNNGSSAEGERRGKVLHAEQEYRGEQLSERALNMLMLDRQNMAIEIARLEANLEKGNTRTVKMASGDEHLKNLSIEIGRELTEEIIALKAKLQTLEERIVQGGGNLEALQ